MTDPPPEPVAPQGRRRLRWGATAGLVVFGYVVWVAVDLVVAASSRGAFTRLHALYGSLGARLVLSVVVVAALFHTLDGVRRMLEELRPSLARHDAGVRVAVSFLTAALAVPAVVVVLWPSIRGGLG